MWHEREGEVQAVAEGATGRREGPLERRTATADAALDGREIVGAAVSSALGADARGGEVARFVGLACGFGRG